MPNSISYREKFLSIRSYVDVPFTLDFRKPLSSSSKRFINDHYKVVEAISKDIGSFHFYRARTAKNLEAVRNQYPGTPRVVYSANSKRRLRFKGIFVPKPPGQKENPRVRVSKSGRVKLKFPDYETRELMWDAPESREEMGEQFEDWIESWSSDPEEFLYTFVVAGGRDTGFTDLEETRKRLLNPIDSGGSDISFEWCLGIRAVSIDGVERYREERLEEYRERAKLRRRKAAKRSYDRKKENEELRIENERLKRELERAKKATGNNNG
jgi:hypothetical protein